MYKVCDAVRSTHSRDGAVVLDVQQGKIFTLNLVGSKILQLLVRGYTEDVITAEISRDFGAQQEVVRADLKEFLQMLTRHGLIDTSERKTVCSTQQHDDAR